MLALLLLFGASMSEYFNDGLADPMMASALITSVSLFIHYGNRDGKDMEWLWIAAICGVVAAYSKQPALIWAAVALPMLTLVKTTRRQWPLAASWVAGASLLLSVAWIIGEGSGFQRNPGVIIRSLDERSLIEQLMFAAKTYFVNKPVVLLLLLAGLIAVIRAGRYRGIFFILLVPSTVAWLILGAYDLRLGIHVVSLATLLVSATDYDFGALQTWSLWERMGGVVRRYQARIFIGIGALMIAYAYTLTQKAMQEIG